jgi:hypothetical protein
MYDLPFKVKEMAFASMEDCKEWMIRNQFGRRNLSNYQRSVLALELKKVFSEKAKEKELERDSFSISKYPKFSIT